MNIHELGPSRDEGSALSRPEFARVFPRKRSGYRTNSGAFLPGPVPCLPPTHWHRPRQPETSCLTLYNPPPPTCVTQFQQLQLYRVVFSDPVPKAHEHGTVKRCTDSPGSVSNHCLNTQRPYMSVYCGGFVGLSSRFRGQRRSAVKLTLCALPRCDGRPVKRPGNELPWQRGL
ncbi:hypothetical protein Bbelb_024050 [Branchiostoma belcheri]|nr:hypothetical protein Bbelb_024050 [Branchiostoma belcheri]